MRSTPLRQRRTPIPRSDRDDLIHEQDFENADVTELSQLLITGSKLLDACSLAILDSEF